jgi:Ca-activated chloride channel family protein
MTDELQKMKEAFRAEEPVAPDPEIKKHAVERAMAAFDEKNSPQTQGSGFTDRLKGTATAALETLIGRRPMKLNPAIAGGASFSVLMLAVLSTNYVQTHLKSPVVPSSAEPPLITAPKEKDKLSVTNQPTNKLEEAFGDGSPAGNRGATRKLRADAEQKSRIVAAPPPAPQVAYDASGPVALKAPSSVSVDALGRSAGALVGGVPATVPVAKGQAQIRQLVARPSTMLRQEKRDQGGYRPVYQDQGRDQFEETVANPVKVVSEDPVSTFSIDVDTASYAFMRASLNRNVLPQKNSVRIEELVNYFPYDYELPKEKSAPFKATATVIPSPWKKENRIVHIGIKGFDIKPAEKPRSNLVFLLDTSGSMNAPNKLPLLRNSMKLLLETLEPEDTVAIVTYAGNAGTALEPTKVKEKAKILGALNALHSAGSTAGAEGIRQAYDLAGQNFDKGGVNRVILATDGDFNVGITNREELKSFVERKRKTGVFLSVLGFGMGNYNDALMQTLAQNGNGNAAYIDSLNEARKVLVEEASSTLFTIAKDVKIQVEFNPATVSEYRLIGYETRLLNREDFANDKVDAGEIGSGHTVTALYEITPKGSTSRLVEELRYGMNKVKKATSNTTDEYAYLKIRYKLPNEETSKLITAPIAQAGEFKSIESAPQEARFATSVAAFGQLLKGGRYTGSYSYDDVINLAQKAKGDDPFGYRSEFINLVRLAKSASALEPLSSTGPVRPMPR